MKKLVLMFAAAAMAVSASAQTTQESKFFDNWYLGVNVGAATKTTHNAWFKNVNPSAGVRLGKWFTPVWGAAVEADLYARNRNLPSTHKTLVRGMSGKFIGTINATNLFLGYKGEPRNFEIIPLAGFGGYHSFNLHNGNINALVANAGVDFAFNLGAKKAWQVYVEPSMNWFLHDNQTACDGVQFDVNKSAFQVKVGVNYKFKGSNNSHNFTIVTPRDQNEIDGLNGQINSLRNDLNGKDAEIASKDKQIQDLQNALNECNKRPKTNAVASATATNLQPTVLFRVGKSVIDRSQMANIEMIAQYMKNHPDATIEIKGYASPEGSKELNQKLSEARAEAVKNVLVKTYKIKANRLITKGMGATDKLFKQVEFNRVATFNDNNEK